MGSAAIALVMLGFAVGTVFPAESPLVGSGADARGFGVFFALARLQFPGDSADHHSGAMHRPRQLLSRIAGPKLLSSPQIECGPSFNYTFTRSHVQVFRDQRSTLLLRAI